VPEGKTHLTLRTFLYRLLAFALGPAHSTGSDQFIYWNAADPRRCLSPDVFVKLDVPDSQFGSWKTWERGGPPELAVEIISPNEGDGVAWEEKLARYHECGVRELVRFDPDAPVGRRLRVWDRVDDDLVERVVEADRTPCVALGFRWCIFPVEQEEVGLRLVRADESLVESELEVQLRATEAETRAREAETRAREAETSAREAAEARVRELEAELARRR
jgi:Uma2 family endonuclease